MIIVKQSIGLDSRPSASTLPSLMAPVTHYPKASSRSDILALAKAYAHESGFVWLDSSMQLGDRGTKSLLARRPVIDVGYLNGETVVSRDHEVVRHSWGAAECLEFVSKLTEDTGLTAVGYIAYEACLPFVGLTELQVATSPQIRFLCYDSVLEFDHRNGDCLLTNPALNPFDSTPEIAEAVEIRGSIHATFHAAVSHEQYLAKVVRIKEHIREGDIYQANYTCRFDITRADDPFEVYQRLRALSPAPYAAFLNFGDIRILSSSPERMLHCDGSRITTSPIKGTIGAGESPAEQEQNRQRLLNSEKDRAELLMIVDLERNDLGKIARTGTVKVDSLFRAEEYRSLFHLVSDISAEIEPSLSMANVLQALLPGGSITGAPKRRAIEILSQIETTPRGVYTGCIGYMQPGKADFNIAIRTIIHQNQTYYVHAGGGIVADSQPEAEYEEMLLKASNMFRAIGLSEEEIRCLRR